MQIYLSILKVSAERLKKLPRFLSHLVNDSRVGDEALRVVTNPYKFSITKKYADCW